MCVRGGGCGAEGRTRSICELTGRTHRIPNEIKRIVCSSSCAIVVREAQRPAYYDRCVRRTVTPGVIQVMPREMAPVGKERSGVVWKTEFKFPETAPESRKLFCSRKP